MIATKNDYGLLKSVIDENNGYMNILQSDNYAEPLERFLSEKLNTTAFASAPVVDDLTVTLTAGHGAVVGNFLEIWEANTFEQIEIVGVATNTITLAYGVPFPFSTNAVVKVVNVDVNVDGSVTNKCFTFQSESGIWDISRFIWNIVSSAQPDDTKFGGITGLTASEGLLLENNIDFPVTPQTPGGIIRFTLANIKDNRDMRYLGYDLNYADRANPQGDYSTSIRKTTNGAEKSGTVYRIFDKFPLVQDPDFIGKNRIEARVRADLTDLESFRIVVHGHRTNETPYVVI